MILQRYESVVMKNMMNLEAKKEQEIKNMVTILEQIDLPDIILLVKDITAQVLEELDSDTTYGDEVGLVDSDRGEEFTTLDDFVRIFWDKAVEKILNVVESQGR